MTAEGGPGPAQETGHPLDPRAILSGGELEALLAPVEAAQPARVLVLSTADEWPSIARAFERLGVSAIRERSWQRALDRLRRDPADIIVGTARALGGARETFIRRVREASGPPAILLAVPAPAPPVPDGVIGLPASAAELARWVVAPTHSR